MPAAEVVRLSQVPSVDDNAASKALGIRRKALGIRRNTLGIRRIRSVEPFGSPAAEAWPGHRG